MRVLLIANPNSTTQHEGLFRRIIPAVRGIAGVELVGKFTRRPGHAEHMCTGLRRSDYDVVIAVGGDGTVNEVINGLLGPVGPQTPDATSLPAVAVIPTGSANVFARALGFSADPVAATDMLVELLRRDLRRLICLGTWNERWFAVNVGFGIDADVISRVDEARRLGFAATPLRYLFLALFVWRRANIAPPKIDLQARASDGRTLQKWDLPLLVASNTNPWTFLGPLPVVTNPRNSFDQGLGLFGLSSLKGVRGVLSMLHLVGFGHRALLEGWLEKNTLRFDDAGMVRLSTEVKSRFQADGEYEGEFDVVELSSRANALEVYAPTTPFAFGKRSVGRVLRDLIRIR